MDHVPHCVLPMHPHVRPELGGLLLYEMIWFWLNVEGPGELCVGRAWKGGKRQGLMVHDTTNLRTARVAGTTPLSSSRRAHTSHSRMPSALRAIASHRRSAAGEAHASCFVYGGVGAMTVSQ